MIKKFVSRAGEKLEFAINEFNISVSNKICADLGSSTGGFVDCLLKYGAKKIYSVDTAYGELDWNLRNNDKVVVLERTNALHLNLPEKVDLITIDVAWTKQRLIIPKALQLIKHKGIIISLIKPQYEVDPKYLRKGKIDEDLVDKVIVDIGDFINSLEIQNYIIKKSPLYGKKGGNIEFLMYITV